MKTAGTLLILYIMLVLVILVGWVNNLLIVVASIQDPITTELIIRIVGVFAAPLGGVMGYI